MMTGSAGGTGGSGTGGSGTGGASGGGCISGSNKIAIGGGSPSVMPG